ncbi:MAG: hypothetical protein HZB76_06515 [Chlamydiae bacterium]|nr:hypothetical protein [Chlamydiota bacterium]
MTGFKEVRSRWQRRIKILIISLIISGVLNSLFLGVFIYSAIKDKQFYAVFSSKRPIKFPSAKKEMNNPQYLAYFSSFSFRDLLPYLFNTELVEEGYTKRDLALACLVSFHNFNIEKALPGQTYLFYCKDGKSPKTKALNKPSRSHQSFRQ